MSLTETPADNENDVTLTWSTLLATDTRINGGDTIIGYDVEFKTSEDDDDAWTNVDTETVPVDTATVNHDDRAPGTTYQYRISAVNGVTADTTNDDDDGARGPWSNVVEADIDPILPGAPRLGNDDLSPNVTSMTIDWDVPLDMNGEEPSATNTLNDGGAAITTYEIWVGTETSGPTPAVNTATGEDALTATITGLPATRTEYDHLGLRPETAYFYRVRAKNSVGVGPWSEEATMSTTGSTPGTPGAPAAPTGNIAGSTITIEWEPPTNLGTTPITGYMVQYVRDDDNAATPVEIQTLFSAATTVPISTPTTETWDHDNPEGGIEDGTNFAWSYRVAAVNSSGAGDWSDKLRVGTPPRAPAAPMLTATALSDTEILLEWNVPTSNGTTIDGYDVRRWNEDATNWGTDLLFDDPDVVGDDTDSASTTALTVVRLVGGTEYFFAVRAQAAAEGDDGLWSAEGVTASPVSTAGAESATTPDGVPGAPALDTVDNSDIDDDDVGTVRLTLTLATADGGSDITRYELQIWYNGQWNAADDLEANDDPQVIEDLTPGVRYYFATRAHNSVGPGPWSSPVASAVAKIGPPDAPALKAMAIDGESIKLTWTAPEANGSTIIAYELQRWAGSSWPNNSDLLDGTIPLLTEFTDSGRDSGTEYFYRIRAMTTASDGGEWSTEGDNGDATNEDAASAKTLGDVPNQVGTMEVPIEVGPSTAPPGGLTVSWTKLVGAARGGSAITGYDVQIWDSASQQWVDEASLGDVDTYDDAELAGGATYYYRVRARNSEGPGPWGDYASNQTVVLVRVPDAPELTATTAGTDTIRLTWTKPNDNGMPITGYMLERWNTDVSPAAWSDAIMIAGGDQTLYVDVRLPNVDPASPLKPGTTYYYRLRTIPADNDNPAWSTVVSATTVADAPGRPGMVNAKPDGENAIDLSWDAPMSDGGNAIVHYHIELWNTDSRSWTRVTVISATHTTYKHRGRDAGTRYIYRVRAENRAPTDNGLGPWSTLTSATTDAAEE